MLQAFTQEVRKQLKHYVYRLIDPRTGQTFYVGKGKDNRVFAHVKDALRNYEGEIYLEEGEDNTSTKIQQIRDIKNAGFEVVMVIHRWGMDEETAYEVESALMDCYPCLTNRQSGHDSDRGLIDTTSLQHTLGLKEFDDSKAASNEYMIIKINQNVLDSRGGNVYNTAKRAWHIDPDKAQSHKYILVCLFGEVIAIYKNAKWHTCDTEPDRWEFDADEANSKEDAIIIERYLHKRLPKRYMKKGLRCPVLYLSI